jgi:hypothetical protein
VTFSGLAARFHSFLWPVVIGLLALLFYIGVRHKRDLVDFKVYETAASRALRAEPLYRAEDGHWQFKYLPAFALLMAPFAKMPPEVADLIWFALSVALLVVFLRVSARELPDTRLTESGLMWLTVLLLGKCFVKELILGQTNLLLGVILMGALITARRKQPAMAGSLVGLAVFIKPYALILVPWLALVLGIPALASFAVVLAAGLALPIVIYGWRGNLDIVASWYRTVTDTTAPNLLFPENISIGTMWAKWIGPTCTARALAVATSAAAAAMAGLAGVWRRRVRQPDYLEFGLLLLLVPLISPQGWDYVLLLGAPVVMCLIDRWPRMPMAWRLAAGAAMAIMGFTIFDLLGRTLYGHLMKLSIITVAAMLCAACGLYLRGRALA